MKPIYYHQHGPWIWRSIQILALAVIGLYLYIFFTCFLTDFHFLGIQIQRPGDLAIPLLLSIFLLSFRIQPWNWSDRFSQGMLYLVFLFFFCILFHPHAGSDAAQYYANLRSLWLDGDLNFYDDALNNIGEDYLRTLHLGGYTYNGFSVGPAFFWSPFFLLAHWGCLLVNEFQIRYACEGYDYPYLLLVCASSALYGFAGMVLCWRLLKKWVSPGIAAWATLLVVFASPLLLYLVHEGAYSHALGFFMGTAIVILWWKRYETFLKSGSVPSFKSSASFGLAIGLAMLIRWQSGIFLIFPFFDFLSQGVGIFKNREKEKKSIGKWLSSNAVLLVFLGIAVFPQLAVWKVQTGHWLHVPQGEGYFPNWWQPKIDKVLFSGLHGLFSWHPVLLFAALCFPLLWKNHRAFLVRAACVLLAQVYINSVVHDWWAGGSFGQRRFCASLVLFAVPLALGLQKISSESPKSNSIRWLRSVVIVLSVFLLLSNLILLTQYMHGSIGSMGKLEPGKYLKSWVDQKENVFSRLQAVLVYMPYSNRLAFGILFGDGKLFFGAFFHLLILSLIAWMILIPSWIKKIPGFRWLIERWVAATTLCLLLFSGLIGLAAYRATSLWIVNLRPEVPFGNVRNLTVSKSHRYVGGYVDRTLGPGEVLSVGLDRKVSARSVILTSYIKGGGNLQRAVPVGRIILEDDQGGIRKFELLPGIHTDACDAMAHLRYRDSTGQPGLQAARRWRPSKNAPYHECSWYAEWPLLEPLTISKLELQSYLKEGDLQVEGIAFRPTLEEEIRPTYRMALRCVPVDFGSLCNVAYDHNVFIPHDNKTYSHFKFSSLTLYKDLIPFSLYPPYDESGRWNALTTCFENGKTFHIPIHPPCSLESLQVAFAAGMVRTRSQESIADIVLVYQSGKRQVRNLLTNREGFDYLHGYRPGGSVIEGGESGYMYDGKVSYLEIRVEEKTDPVIAIEVIDSNGKDKAGISILAMTMVIPESEISLEKRVVHQRQTTQEIPDEYIAMDYDDSNGEFLLSTRKASLFRQLQDGSRVPVTDLKGSVAEIAILPQTEDYLVLSEEGTVFDSRKPGKQNRIPLPLGQKTVAIEWNKQGTSYYILTDAGEVITVEKESFPNWDRKVQDRFIDFEMMPSGETWIGMTQRGSFVWAGKRPNLELPQEPKWNWDIARDMVVLEKGLILLDGFGGIHSYGEAPSYLFAGYQTNDVYVALKIDANQELLILDRSGKIHKVKKQ